MKPGFPEGDPSASRSVEDRGERAPVLVLALGNRLLEDDAAGIVLLESLRPEAERRWGTRVDLVDGGTQGLALLGILEGRAAVVFLDAAALDAAPGTVHLLRGDDLLDRAAGPGTTAHETSAADLLRAASLIGDLPPRITLVGIEPEQVRTGLGLTARVEASLPEARRLAFEEIRRAVADL
jgi:hydrogenase maturation protease